LSMPPKDVEASELFVLLTTTPRPHRVVDLPRKKTDGTPVGQVAIVPLTQEEVTAASAESERRTRKMLGDALPKKEDAQQGYSDVYTNIAAVEILFRACKDIKDETLRRGAFRTPHEIGKALSNDEIGVLYHSYQTVMLEIGPIVAHMSESEVDAWVDVLAEGGSSIPLDTLSWGALTTLTCSMASRLRALRTDTSSPGSPHDTPSGDAGTTES
jgi:hypothetical protein